MLLPHSTGASPVHALSSPHSRCASSDRGAAAMNAAALASVGTVFCVAMADPSDVEVRLQDADRGVPTRVVVLRAREEVVAVVGVVAFQRGGQQCVDLVV